MRGPDGASPATIWMLPWGHPHLFEENSTPFVCAASLLSPGIERICSFSSFNVLPPLVLSVMAFLYGSRIHVMVPEG